MICPACHRETTPAPLIRDSLDRWAAAARFCKLPTGLVTACDTDLVGRGVMKPPKPTRTTHVDRGKALEKGLSAACHLYATTCVGCGRRFSRMLSWDAGELVCDTDGCEHRHRHRRRAGVAKVRTPGGLRRDGSYYQDLGARVDFEGALEGGRRVLLEAKSTDDACLAFDRVGANQRKALEQNASLGGLSALVVRIGDVDYLVPWAVASGYIRTAPRKSWPLTWIVTTGVALRRSGAAVLWLEGVGA